MKKCTKCGVIKELSEFNSHGGRKKRPDCRDCQKNDKKLYYKKNKECINERGRLWYRNNKEWAITQHREYRARNEGQVFQLQKRYRDNNAEKRKADNARWRESHADQHRANAIKWSKNNRHMVSVTNTKRRGQSRLATPEWANKFFMAEAYDLARRRTRCTGFKWHVDHVVPLRSKLVCGLHCEQNMEVIPAVDNLKKRHFTWPDMP